MKVDDRRLCESLVRLSSNPDFQVLGELLKAELNKCDVATRTLESVPLYRTQGRAIFIAELIRAPDDARKILGV